MEITAQTKFAHISPKKVKPLLADLRGKGAQEVLSNLKYARSKAGQMLFKAIASALANAINNYNFKPDNLKIKSLVADEGPRYKRYWLRSHGAADIRLKRMTHIKVVLEGTTPVKGVSKPTVSKRLSKSGLGSAEKTSGAPAAPAKVKSVTSTPPKGKLGGRKLFTRTTNK